MSIIIKTDSNPDESSWTLFEGDTLIGGYPSFEEPFQLNVTEFCLVPGVTYNATVYDSFGDGLACSSPSNQESFFEIQTNGNVIHSICGSFSETFFLFQPTLQPTLTRSLTAAPPRCSSSEALFALNLHADDWPSETKWTLEEMYGTNSFESPTYHRPGEYDYTVCLSKTSTYKFTISDSFGDGICCDYGGGKYTIMLDSIIQRQGGEFGSSESTILYPGGDLSS